MPENWVEAFKGKLRKTTEKPEIMPLRNLMKLKSMFPKRLEKLEI